MLEYQWKLIGFNVNKNFQTNKFWIFFLEFLNIGCIILWLCNWQQFANENWIVFWEAETKFYESINHVYIAPNWLKIPQLVIIIIFRIEQSTYSSNRLVFEFIISATIEYFVENYCYCLSSAIFLCCFFD